MNQFDVIDAFTNAMRSAGIEPEFKPGQGIEFGLAAGGKPHRFHVAGDGNGTRNGWYVVFSDGLPAGEFGSWKTGVRQPWCAKGNNELTEHDRAEIRDRMEIVKAAREAEQREREGEAAKTANLVWEAAEDATDDHPYLMRKEVRAHGLRVGSWPLMKDGEVYKTLDNCLLVPLMTTKGKIVSLQAIFPKKEGRMGRDKDFLAGGRKTGAYHMIGRPRAGVPVCVCEGYATGASIHEATGYTVCVAFDAGNLVAVAEAMREAMPTCEMVIAADNDQWTHQPVENPGVHFAERAAVAGRARVVVPQFASLEDHPTDFNDLAVREGQDAVQRQMMPPVRDAVVIDGDTGEVEEFNPNAVDGYTPFGKVDGKGRPLATIENVTELLQRARISCSYNVISKDLEIMLPGVSFSRDNAANASMTTVVSMCEGMGFPTKNLAEYMLVIGERNKRNPVAEWIESVPWDGVSRLADFYSTVTAKRDTILPCGGSLKELLMRKWLISAVAAAFMEDGFMCRGVLVFQSKQNLGKTLWVKRLAPKSLGVIRDGLILNPSNKDDVMAFASNWIVELGELDGTMRKADLAALKGFISLETDSLRRPYARGESKYPRRTVVFASVNDEEFLQDTTGNTRWWVVAVEALNNAHTIPMQQLWAEVLTIFRAGETWHLTPEQLEHLNSSNLMFTHMGPIEERIRERVPENGPEVPGASFLKCADIAVELGYDPPETKHTREIARVMKLLNVPSKNVKGTIKYQFPTRALG